MLSYSLRMFFRKSHLNFQVVVSKFFLLVLALFFPFLCVLILVYKTYYISFLNMYLLVCPIDASGESKVLWLQIF